MKLKIFQVHNHKNDTRHPLNLPDSSNSVRLYLCSISELFVTESVKVENKEKILHTFCALRLSALWFW